MSFEDFIKMIKNLEIHISNYDPANYSYGNKNDGHFISVSWVSGGQTGGSCWDSGEHTHKAISSEPPEELKDIDTILEKICPNISFLQYKIIVNDAVYAATRTSNDYYGNYTEYAYKICNLKKLYDKLVEKNLISLERPDKL